MSDAYGWQAAARVSAGLVVQRRQTCQFAKASNDANYDKPVSAPTTGPPPLSTPQRPRRRRGRIFFWLLFGICLAAMIGSFVALKTSSRVFLEPSVSMADTIMPGDRVFVVPTGQVHRGDIIVEGQGGDASDDLYIRRVVGLPGDHVVCCDAQGRITVNGKPLNETYLYPGDQPSYVPFDVSVPAGEYWLLGDHRRDADDSRYLGPLHITIIGRVDLLYRSGRFITVTTPQTFIADGLAPASSGVPAGLVALGVSLVAWPLLLVLIIFGTIRWIIRRIRRRRTKSRAPAPDPTETPGSGIPSAGD
jgi:signal peptidase I